MALLRESSIFYGHIEITPYSINVLLKVSTLCAKIKTK